ncbi:MAG: hypothetical protein Q7R35_04810 [Elusimicrobiota bacterium]|nr:hypothetical protein [Elusimicrobiota bacterium]
MKKILLWLLSFLITAGFAVFQRATGPTYPARGSLLTASGVKVSYRLPRSCTIGANDCGLKLKTDKPLSGIIEWKRYKTSDPVTAVPFTASPDRPCAFAPDQPPAGKLEYAVYAVENGARSLIGPQKVVTRFKGAVPAWVLAPHIFFMFFFMMISVRLALSALMNWPIMKSVIFLNLAFLAAGGFILGPLTQHYAFGAYWTGFPFGHDLTDNKTLLPLIFWAAAAVSVMRGGANLRKWVLAAFLATAAVYFIPHSVLGSELDYSTLEKTGSQQVPAAGKNGRP